MNLISGLKDMSLKAATRGEIKALSAGQKLLLDIGRKKLEQLAVEFKKKGNKQEARVDGSLRRHGCC